MIYLLEFFRVQLTVSVLLGLVFVPKVWTFLSFSTLQSNYQSRTQNPYALWSAVGFQLNLLWAKLGTRLREYKKQLESFSIAFTENGKRQAEIFSSMKNNEAFFGLSLSPPSRRQLSSKHEKERSEYEKHKFMHFRTNSGLTFPIWR